MPGGFFRAAGRFLFRVGGCFLRIAAAFFPRAAGRFLRAATGFFFRERAPFLPAFFFAIVKLSGAGSQKRDSSRGYASRALAAPSI